MDSQDPPIIRITAADETAYAGSPSTHHSPLDQHHDALLNWRSDVVVTDEVAIVQHVRATDSGPTLRHTAPSLPAMSLETGIVETEDMGIFLSLSGQPAC